MRHLILLAAVGGSGTIFWLGAQGYDTTKPLVQIVAGVTVVVITVLGAVRIAALNKEKSLQDENEKLKNILDKISRQQR